MSLQNFDFQKLNPFHFFKPNGFKHEQPKTSATVPVQRETSHHGSVENYSVANNDPFVQLHRQLDRLFDGFGFPSMFALNRQTQPDSLWPSLNVAAERDKYLVTLEAVGMDEKDISLEVSDQQLVITGNKQQNSESQDRHYYRIERHYGAFQRVLSLPDDAVSEDIRATIDKGLLTIRVPRREDRKNSSRRQIEITRH